MGQITVLDASLASQIAAGEVVERPASALKELIENSLDAQSKRIDIEIEGGGITRLSVRDDGLGMSAEDAVLSVQRHATSKIRRIEELSNLSSYGFRGEALPSIASVSHFTLQTRQRDTEAGTQVQVNAGSPPQLSDVGMAPGTWIEVSDLFYNVPARRKFLRSSGTESSHVTEVVDNAALSVPGVTFTLQRDGRRARQWLRAPDRETRVRNMLEGEELALCQGSRGPLSLEAFLGRPERARNGAAGLKLLCNGRPVRDRTLLTTVAQAFGSVLERGRYPRGVIFLEIAPELVDVNVHPQKTEVRFADPRPVADSLYQILSAQLAQAFSLPPPAANRWKPQAGASTPPPARQAAASTTRRTDQAAASTTRRTDQAAPLGAYPAPRHATLSVNDSADAPSRPRAVQNALPLNVPTQSVSTVREEASRQHEPPAAIEGSRNGEASTQSSPVSPDPEMTQSWKELRYIGQARGTFLLCEGRQGLYILDQHAAAERVTFHRLKTQYYSREVAAQALLFPLVTELSPEEMELVERHQEEFLAMGFEWNRRTASSATLHTVPRLLQGAEPEALVQTLLSELGREGRDFSASVDLTLATMACHASLRSGERIAPEQAESLLNALDEVDFAGHCPHGRPVVTLSPWSELERKVGRR